MLSFGLVALHLLCHVAFSLAAIEFVGADFDYFVDDSVFAVDDLAVCVDSEKKKQKKENNENIDHINNIDAEAGGSSEVRIYTC